MKLNSFLLCLAAILSFSVVSFAQDEAEEVVPDGWTRGASLGADLGQLLQFNPRVGAGENRVGVGMSFGAFANKKQGLSNWDNSLTLNLAIQRLGGGIIAPASTITVPWQKSADELRLASLYGMKFNETSPWGYGAQAIFITQLTPTYADAAGRNLLKTIDATNAGVPIAKFLSSATFSLSPGITYRPSDHFDMLISPASYKTIFVVDEDVAALDLYDYLDPDMDGSTSLQQLGATVAANYNNSYLEDDRLLVKTSLILFSNYLSNPQNVDIDWRTEIGFAVFKGLTLSLNTIVQYDDDVPVQVTDYDAVGGVRLNADGTKRLGKRASITEQLLLKYAIVF
ncbi:MAG: DUF3078 domain-containing protein [Saprospiraceae bacterium]